MLQNFRNGRYQLVLGDGGIVQFQPNASIHHFANVMLLITYEGYPYQRYGGVRGFLETLQTALRYEQLHVTMG
jgi:hypothetical protein